MRRNRNWNRREFLKAAGIGTGALFAQYIPFLEQEAQAQGGFPKRLVLITTPCGSMLPKWRPTNVSSATNFELSYILKPFESDPGRPGGASHKNKLLILDGLDSGHIDGGGHDHRAVIFSGQHLSSAGAGPDRFHSGESIDQTIARRINQETANPEGLHLGVAQWERGDDGKSPRGHAFAKKNPAGGLAIPFSPMIDPRTAYDTIFRGASGSAGSEKDSLRRGLIFSHIKNDLASLHAKLSKSDQNRLDQHLDSVNQLEKRLASGASCNSPTRPPQYAAEEIVGRTESAKIPEITEDQLSIAAAALACDLTRVIGFQWGTDGSTGRVPYVAGFGGSDIHAVSHGTDATSQNRMADINRWFSLKFARFLDKLVSYQEGDGTLLDNTLVVWIKAISSGATHSRQNNPVVLMQGKNSYFPMGRYLTWGSFADMEVRNGMKKGFKDYGGKPINRLLVSICHAMGLEDITKVGNGDPGTGPLDKVR